MRDFASNINSTWNAHKSNQKENVPFLGSFHFSSHFLRFFFSPSHLNLYPNETIQFRTKMSASAYKIKSFPFSKLETSDIIEINAIRDAFTGEPSSVRVTYFSFYDLPNSYNDSLSLLLILSIVSLIVRCRVYSMRFFCCCYLL